MNIIFYTLYVYLDNINVKLVDNRVNYVANRLYKLIKIDQNIIV